MCVRHLLTLMVLLLAPISTASPAQAGGVVAVCDEAHLRAALAGGGTVTFACSGTITLSSTITIEADTTIDGTGQEVTISGNNTVGVFAVNEAVALAVTGLAIANGSASYGGGIFTMGTLTVTNSTFSGNHASNGGAIGHGVGSVIVDHCTFNQNYAVYRGGGLDTNDGVLTVTNSTFSGNSASSGGGVSVDSTSVTIDDTSFKGNSANSGGGISGFGQLSVNSSTFSGNSAGYGGGIYGWSGSAHVSNSTFAENSANEGGVIYIHGGSIIVTNSTLSRNSADRGGNIRNAYGYCTAENAIIANSPIKNNCYGPITDGGGNLSYPDATCPGINADPKLGLLQDNGGPTWTMALSAGSSAIDAGDDAICAAPPVNNLDQRGFPRPWGAHCDIGAVEQILEPSAVRLSTIGAGRAPDTRAIPPTFIFALLLVTLAGIGACRPRPENRG